MRVPGRTWREPTTFTPATACIKPKTMTIDGEVFDYVGECCEPGCPVHGFEAQTIARSAYIPEPSQEEAPIIWKGRDSR